MRKALELLQQRYRDQSFIALGEWINATGEMGLYQSKHGHIFLVILNYGESDYHYSEQSYRRQEIDAALTDAKVIAKFAGAKEV